MPFLFILHVLLGRWIASRRPGGIDLLAASMFLAALAISPIGQAGAPPAFTRPALLLAAWASACAPQSSRA